MTPNEATIVGGLAGGIIGGIVSLFTTRYVIKHGPNYENKIDEVNITLDKRIGDVSAGLKSRIAEMNASLGKLTQAYTEGFESQAALQQAEVARQDAREWKPDAHIDIQTDSISLSNYLIIKARDTFSLVSIKVQNRSGAVLAVLPVDKRQESTGFRVPIDHKDILKVKQSANLGGLQNGALGNLAYQVRRLDRSYDFVLPFTTQDVLLNSTIFIKLIG